MTLFQDPESHAPRDAMLHLRVTTEEYDELRRVLQQQGIGMSILVRRALAMYMSETSSQ